MNQGTLTVGSLYAMANSRGRGESILLVHRIQNRLVLVSKYCLGRFLPVPLFVEDWNEIVLVASELLMSIEELHSTRRLNRDMILTNRPLIGDTRGGGIRRRQFLCCRYTAKISDDIKSGSIRRLCTGELPQTAQASFDARRLRIPEADLLRGWLGRNVSFSAYTFGDCFCGAGGASRGAQLAGLRIAWGFDMDSTSGASFRANFAVQNERIVFHHIQAQDFQVIPRSEIHVDVLHLSPPCQAFSAANTSVDGGQHGDLNRDTFLSCLAIIKHARPRVVSLEQVPGLLFNRSQNYFDTFIRDLIDLGFSLRWQILRSDQFGVPQTRKRLVLIASCPGEQLPGMPEAQNVTPKVNDFLAPNLRRPEFETVWKGTLMTAGARRTDGTKLSRHELAAIQSFPREHIFRGSDAAVSRQIGNAVPPQLGRHIFVEILKSLQISDDMRSTEVITIE